MILEFSRKGSARRRAQPGWSPDCNRADVLANWLLLGLTCMGPAGESEPPAQWSVDVGLAREAPSFEIRTLVLAYRRLF